MVRVFAFPGQGSQARGMGAGLFDEFPEHVRRADAILGYSIQDLCLDDNAGRLLSTRYTQPALFTVNALSFLKRRLAGEPMPDAFVGHSLGEYNALFAAGAFDFETGLRLVQKRGELMAEAAPGGMAAVLGLTAERVRQILTASGLRDIDVANYNGPTQTIIAGPRGSLEAAETWFCDDEVSYIPLNVSAAFHSRQMLAMIGEFAHFLEGFDYGPLRIPVIANVDAQPYVDGGIVSRLTAQVWKPVLWEDCIRTLIARGPLQFEEVGPGTVLTGLVSAIVREREPVAGPRAAQSAKVHGAIS
jgi:malonyl CoA-acyl carrier protein transacylase